MKRATKFILGAAAVVIVLGLFLLPIVPVTVAFSPRPDLPSGGAMFTESASASPMYAYFGFGTVYVPNNHAGHSYCLMEGNPGTMCGIFMQLD
jgi:hypothetical protein